jgi:hypothetical protein
VKRDYPIWVFMPIALALGLPTTAVQSKTMIVGMCGGGTQMMRLPIDPAKPFKDGDQNCVGKACHASTDPQKRGTALRLVCR